MTRLRLSLAVLVLGILSGVAYLARDFWQTQPPIRVGILHSLTGPMAVSEKPMVDAALLAIQEINAAGGLLGIEFDALVVVDFDPDDGEGAVLIRERIRFGKAQEVAVKGPGASQIMGIQGDVRKAENMRALGFIRRQQGQGPQQQGGERECRWFHFLAGRFGY